MAKEKSIVKVIDGVGFYPASVEGKDLKQFIEENKHHYDGDEEKLKHAYSIMSKKVDPEKKATPGK